MNATGNVYGERQGSASVAHSYVFNFNSAGIASGIAVGVIRASDDRPVQLSVSVQVATAFNAGTNNFIEIGTTAGGSNLIAHASITAGTPGYYPASNAVSKLRVTANTPIYVTYTQSGGVATTGKGVLIVNEFQENIIPVSIVNSLESSAPANTVAPAFDSTTYTIGDTATGSFGTFAPTPTSYDIQFKVNGNNSGSVVHTVSYDTSSLSNGDVLTYTSVGVNDSGSSAPPTTSSNSATVSGSPSTITRTFAQAQSDGLRVYGRFVGPGVQFGHDCLQWPLVGNEAYIRWRGTDLTLGGYITDADSFQSNTDGAGWVTCGNGGEANWFDDTFQVNGLSQGVHETRFRYVAPLVFFLGFKTGATGGDVFATITGVSPAILVGAGDDAAAPAFANQSYVAREGGALGIETGDLYATGASIASSATSGVYPDDGVRFRGTGTKLQAWVKNNGATIGVWQDNDTDPLSKTTLANDSSYSWVTLASGLSGSHVYEVLVLTVTPLLIGQVRMVGGSIDSGSPPSARPLLIGLGDSITASTNYAGSGSYTDDGWLLRLARTLGYCVVNRGFAGSTVQAADIYAGTAMETRLPDVTGLPVASGSFFIMGGGSNDWSFGLGTVGSFRTSYDNCMSTVRSAFPSISIISTSIIHRGSPSNAPATYNAEISASVAAVSGQYVDYGNSVPTYPGNMPDTVHPNRAGNTEMMAILSPFL